MIAMGAELTRPICVAAVNMAKQMLDNSATTYEEREKFRELACSGLLWMDSHSATQLGVPPAITKDDLEEYFPCAANKLRTRLNPDIKEPAAVRRALQGVSIRLMRQSAAQICKRTLLFMLGVLHETD